MENNDKIPTVSEIMKEISAISSTDNAQMPSVESIQTPSVADIPAMPTLAEAPAAAAQTEAAPVQTAPVQTEAAPVQTVPVQTVPVQTVPVQTVPVQTVPVQTQPVQTAPVVTPAASLPYYIPAQTQQKTGVGRIISVILGIIFSLVGLVLAIGTVAVWIEEPPTDGADLAAQIFASVILLLPLLIGVLLLCFGGKKKTTQQTAVTPGNYAYTSNATGTAVPVSSPVPTVTNAGTTVPTQSANVTSVPIQTDSANPAPAGYQYAAGTPLIPDGGEKYNKSKAFWSGLGSIGCVIGFWALALLADRGSLWLLILPFLLSFDAIRRRKGKSFLGWLGMVLSVISAAFFILIMIIGIQSKMA